LYHFLRNGSIIVDYTVVYVEPNENDAANLTKAIFDLEQGTQLTMYGQNVSVTSSKFIIVKQDGQFCKYLSSQFSQ
jgi:hypothetical protein